MSPHKVDILPSSLALASYGISVNGFLPAEAPLRRLPNTRYKSWEDVIDLLPELLKAGSVREVVDTLPVLDVSHLGSEQELRRAYSILAMIAQAYIWQGPKPSEVRRTISLHRDNDMWLMARSDYPQQSQYHSPKLLKLWKSSRSQHIRR